ncbi:MAG: type II toxin-antitoxin system VapC family toxin [Gammaproteobacteria bacterium]|nr:type II toxin-antitoxin system VapC family toxin [Gammaproteobacteria bacterium]
MLALLDTHAFLWWLADSKRLSRAAYGAIAEEENDISVSAASAWEIVTKYRLGKLPEAEVAALDVSGAIARQGFEPLAITVADAEHAGHLPGPHRDPFDRMLIAQALRRDFAIVSIDAAFDAYGVRRIW